MEGTFHNASFVLINVNLVFGGLVIMGAAPSNFVSICDYKFENEFVYVILYHFDLTSNSTANAVSNSIIKSISG